MSSLALLLVMLSRYTYILLRCSYSCIKGRNKGRGKKRYSRVLLNLCIVAPVDKGGRLGAELHEASEVDGGTRVEVQIRAPEDACVRL